MGTTPKLLRNAAGTSLLVNAGRTALVRNLDGASCPDPCGGCTPISYTTDHPCALVTLSGVVPKVLCTLLNGDGTLNYTARALSTAGINSSFRVVPQEFDGLLGVFYSRNDDGDYISSFVGLIYQYEYTFQDDEFSYQQFMNTTLTLTRCLDGRERILSLSMNTFDGFGDFRYVFEYNYRHFINGQFVETYYYLGDAIPNEITVFNCEDTSVSYAFKDGTATVTLPPSCGQEEPRVFEAIDCATGLSSIYVAIENNPDPTANPPYFPRNGTTLYRPIDPLVSLPQNIGTSWVQQPCNEGSWPTASRCDGIAGQITFDPGDRPPDTNIFTVSAIDYYPDGGADTATPSTGTWSAGDCGTLRLAVRCSTDGINNVPQDIEDQIPETVSYDDVLLNGGSAADFTTLIEIQVVRLPQNGGAEYCLRIPYRCTEDLATGDEYQVTNIQEILCQEREGEPQGYLCGGGIPGFSCSVCFPNCNAHPLCRRLCLACTGVPT